MTDELQECPRCSTYFLNQCGCDEHGEWPDDTPRSEHHPDCKTAPMCVGCADQ